MQSQDAEAGGGAMISCNLNSGRKATDSFWSGMPGEESLVGGWSAFTMKERPCVVTPMEVRRLSRSAMVFIEILQQFLQNGVFPKDLVTILIPAFNIAAIYFSDAIQDGMHQHQSSGG